MLRARWSPKKNWWKHCTEDGFFSSPQNGVVGIDGWHVGGNAKPESIQERERTNEDRMVDWRIFADGGREVLDKALELTQLFTRFNPTFNNIGFILVLCMFQTSSLPNWMALSRFMIQAEVCTWHTTSVCKIPLCQEKNEQSWPWKILAQKGWNYERCTDKLVCSC